MMPSLNGLIERAKVPMAFIGGHLNLTQIPADLVAIDAYHAVIPGCSDRTTYVRTVFALPSRLDEDFIFFVDHNCSTDLATEIIKANYFK